MSLTTLTWIWHYVRGTARSCRYLLYLFSQVFMAIGLLLEDQYVFAQAVIASGVGLGLLFITVTLQGDSRSKCRGHAYSVWLWAVAGGLSAMITIIKLLFGAVPLVDAACWCFFWVFAALAATTPFQLLAVARRYHAHAQSEPSADAVNKALWACIGVGISLLSCVAWRGVAWRGAAWCGTVVWRCTRALRARASV